MSLDRIIREGYADIDMPSVPSRKIIKVCEFERRTRVGKMKTIVLSCGHIDEATATERRKGSVLCFDCYYGEAPDPLGKIVAEEEAAK